MKAVVCAFDLCLAASPMCNVLKPYILRHCVVRYCCVVCFAIDCYPDLYKAQEYGRKEGAEAVRSVAGREGNGKEGREEIYGFKVCRFIKSCFCGFFHAQFAGLTAAAERGLDDEIIIRSVPLELTRNARFQSFFSHL